MPSNRTQRVEFGSITVISKVLRFWLGARSVILFSAALTCFGSTAFRPNISLVERGLDALGCCMVLFYAVKAERLRRDTRIEDVPTQTETPSESGPSGGSDERS
jgi:hypothetical protein